jgi:hypothetical protein
MRGKDSVGSLWESDYGQRRFPRKCLYRARCPPIPQTFRIISVLFGTSLPLAWLRSTLARKLLARRFERGLRPRPFRAEGATLGSPSRLLREMQPFVTGKRTKGHMRTFVLHGVASWLSSSAGSWWLISTCEEPRTRGGDERRALLPDPAAVGSGSCPRWRSGGQD